MSDCKADCKEGCQGGEAKDSNDSKVVEKLTVRHIDIVDAKNNIVATLCAAPGGGSGLWLKGPQGHSIEIVNVADGVYVGLRRAGNKTADDIAMAVDKDGPFVQIVGPDKLYHLRPQDIISKLAGS